MTVVSKVVVKSIEELKSSDQWTVLESWASEIETLHSEQAVCNVRYLFPYSKTFLQYRGEEKIMLFYVMQRPL